MTRRISSRHLLVGVGLLAVLAVGVAAVRVVWHRGHAAHQPASVYYCPMHPTYTADRPGDCPICNMKLVKREEEPASHQSRVTSHQQNTLKDICYLHNCPMIHQGKPCPMLVVAKAGEHVTCPICGTHVTEPAQPPHAKHILYWTDPMIPGYRSDKPGKSPMGMDLVPVYAEATGNMAESLAPDGYAPVLLTPQKQQLIGVTTAPVQTRAMTKTIRTVGRIAYDPQLYQAEAEYLQALNALLQAHTATHPGVLQQATQLVESSRLRLTLLGLSPELIQEMTSWNGPDQRLLLADPSGQAWLYAPIYEFELPLVRTGQRVTIELPAIPGKTLEGTIRAIDSVLDPTTRSARVRAVVADPESVLKPEMYVNASIVVTLGEVVAISEEAVFQTGTRAIVFVDKGQGLFEPRDAILGVNADGFYEVKGGVAEGEVVVTSGNFLIDSESRLKAALQGAGGGAHQHGP